MKIHTQEIKIWNSPDPNIFTGKFYQTFKEELIWTQKTEEEGTLPNLFYEASITPILKPDKENSDIKTKDIQENYKTISFMILEAKILKKY